MTRTVFVNANVLDADTQSQAPCTVIIEGERIAGIFPAEVPGRRESDAVYNLSGKTLMPGMTIGHFHATYADVGPTSLPIGMESPPPMQAIRATKTLALALHSGFTSVASAGAPYAIDPSCKKAIELGLIEGPRMLAGSRDVSTTGHSQDQIFAWHWDGAGPQTLICNGAEEFRRAVREEVKRGADLIKIFATSGHGLPIGDYSQEMTDEELSTAIATAHERGRRIRGHIAAKRTILFAVNAGIDIVDHGDGMDDECVDLMVERGVFHTPSLFLPDRICKAFSGPMADETRVAMEAMLEILPRANRAGLKITLGDDYGVLWLKHGEYGGELEYYVKTAGIPAHDVITWATRNGADLMGRSHELGLVKQGFLADLVVVDGDPLADIALLKEPKSILAVVKGGTFVKNNLTLEPFGVGTTAPEATAERRLEHAFA